MKHARYAADSERAAMAALPYLCDALRLIAALRILYLPLACAPSIGTGGTQAAEGRTAKWPMATHLVATREACLRCALKDAKPPERQRKERRRCTVFTRGSGEGN